ncbi:MAG: threonine synthase [Myxococcales bacterium]
MTAAQQQSAWLECIRCHAKFPLAEIRYQCDCGGLLGCERPEGWGASLGPKVFDARLSVRSGLDASGVWRFREGVLDARPDEVVTHPEGGTRLYQRRALCDWAGIDQLHFKHEGENPTGSFKDRGMTVAMTQAKRLGSKAVACASTGNTSASLAAYAGQAGLKAVVFVPAGKVAVGKLAQTLAYGALTLQVRGDFDAAMDLVQKASAALGIYLVNSINPFRIEGQKTIVWEILQDLGWQPPDWIAFPAGNLGNTSAFGKALREAKAAGWISKVPRLAAIQAHGANPFFRGYLEQFKTRHKVQAETVASAIRIGDPVSWERARAAIEFANGVVSEVTDEELLVAKREIDRSGIGCEPASACSLAGARKLRGEGVIKPGESVVCILTGNVLKDPEVVTKHVPKEQLVEIDPTVAEVERALK